MDIYLEKINDLFKKSSSGLIYNSNKDHASMIFEKLFSVAKKSVLIYSGGGDSDFFIKENVISAIKALNERETSLIVRIVLDDPESIPKFEELFPNAKISSLHNKQIRVDLTGDISDQEYSLIQHFAVVDDTAYRVELPHEPNAETVKAVACANDKKVGAILLKAFHGVEAYAETTAA